jgi:uncharacterized damage-inducible protein DinB
MPTEVGRVDPALQSDEQTSLTEWLDYHRATLLQKCEGLSGEQLALASVPPSNMTLLGLLRHMLLVEWWWFEHIFANGPAPEPFDTHDDPEYEFTHLFPVQAETDTARFIEECEHSRGIVSAAGSLDELSKSTERDQRDLRWILLHMIEEYARHNGHADLLREAIDGAVGD